jgi:hypothetical protein
VLPTDEPLSPTGESHDPLTKVDLLLERTREIARRIAERVRRATAPDLPTEYRVCVFGLGEHDQTSFTGDGSFAAASAWYEVLKENKAVRQLWLIRRDGALWQFIIGQVRQGPDNPWEAVIVAPAGNTDR